MRLATTKTTSRSNSSRFELNGAGDLVGEVRTSDFVAAPSQTYRDTVALIAGTAPPPITTRAEAESQALMDRLLENWRILPSLSADLVEHVMPRILQPPDAVRLRNCWLVVSAFARAQFVACFPLVQALERERTSYSLLKGAATGFRLYPQPYMRASSDNDVGVTRYDVRFAEQLALEVGFRRAQYNKKIDRFERADPLLRAEVESQHYELGFLVRRVGVTHLGGETL